MGVVGFLHSTQHNTSVPLPLVVHPVNQITYLRLVESLTVASGGISTVCVLRPQAVDTPLSAISLCELEKCYGHQAKWWEKKDFPHPGALTEQEAVAQ